MPIYEYACDACGHRFEEIQKFSDPPIDACPKCRKRSAHRLISRSSFVLKGSGWYVTDYGRGNSGNGRDAKKHDDGAADKKDGDSKPKEPASESKDAKPKTGDAADSKSDSRPAATPGH